MSETPLQSHSNSSSTTSALSQANVIQMTANETIFTQLDTNFSVRGGGKV